jgi:hypothetical protein
MDAPFAVVRTAAQGSKNSDLFALPFYRCLRNPYRAGAAGEPYAQWQRACAVEADFAWLLEMVQGGGLQFKVQNSFDRDILS